MSTQSFGYRKFQFSASINLSNNNHGIVTVEVTTSDAQRMADLGTQRFLYLERWVEANESEFLQVIIDECKVAVDHYVDNIDE
ncbi:hypothetical protein AWB83_05671 [Caballeronia ptereochthonis]|uniref:Uncharacterized protein n=1 Tax=Caballeronia ptereochthonis TaxID=1777144 RepID=A0A158DP97_9BURK|nr:hypothetical protein AWB83_05671 [Caballeronia ptereochthonis]